MNFFSKWRKPKDDEPEPSEEQKELARLRYNEA